MRYVAASPVTIEWRLEIAARWQVPLNERSQPDWNPASPEVLRDQRVAYDEMRRRCPVAYSELLGWSLFRHEDVMRVLLDHKTFSSAVIETRGSSKSRTHSAWIASRARICCMARAFTLVRARP